MQLNDTITSGNMRTDGVVIDAGRHKSLQESRSVFRLVGVWDLVITRIQEDMCNDLIHYGDVVCSNTIATVLDTSKWDAYPAINNPMWIDYSLGWLHVFDRILKEYEYQLQNDNNMEERMFLMRWFEDHKAFIYVCKKWYSSDKTLRDILVRMELSEIIGIPTFSKMEKKCWEYYNNDPDKEETGFRL
jgi:hypothetical protein